MARLTHRLGRARPWDALALLHPGPSLLVTATFIAVSVLAERGLPPPGTLLRLAGIMLPAQFAIGIVNDVFDQAADALAKPGKPLVRGLVGVRTARALAMVFGVISLAVASTMSPLVIAGTVVGLSAGLGYDSGLKHTVASWIPWWLGFASLPFTAFAAVGRSTPALGVTVVLSACLALGLHCANALPDIEADRASAVMSLPVRLGTRRAARWALRWLATAALIGLALAIPTGQGALAFGGSILLLVSVILIAIVRPSRPFPYLAVPSALFAVSWLS